MFNFFSLGTPLIKGMNCKFNNSDDICMLHLASPVRQRGFPAPFCNVLQKTMAETRASPARTPRTLQDPPQAHRSPRAAFLAAAALGISRCPWARAYKLLKTNWGGSSAFTAFLFRLRVFDVLHPLCLPKPDSGVDLPRSFEVCARCRMGDFIKTETSGIPLLLVPSELDSILLNFC